MMRHPSLERVMQKHSLRFSFSATGTDVIFAFSSPNWSMSLSPSRQMSLALYAR